MRQMSKTTATNLSTWRAPRNLEMPHKRQKIRKPRRDQQNTKVREPADKIPGMKDAETGETNRSPPRAATKPAIEPGEEHKIDQQEEHGETPARGRKRPQAEVQREEDRENVDVQNPQAPRKCNCVSHQSQIHTRDCSTTLMHAVPSLSTQIDHAHLSSVQARPRSAPTE